MVSWFNQDGVVDIWQLLQHFSLVGYECIHIVNICNKSPTNKTTKKSKRLTTFWKDYFKHCSIAHKTILVIINISSVTIRSTCFIISNVVLGSMIVVKYTSTGI
jgi:hypothetical protein